jgi:hypothetical protein
MFSNENDSHSRGPDFRRQLGYVLRNMSIKGMAIADLAAEFEYRRLYESARRHDPDTHANQSG